MYSDMRLKLDDGFLRKDVSDKLAFAGMFIAVASVEDATTNGDEGVIKV